MNTKDPRDLGFVFWALSIGISSATCSYFTGGVCTAALFVIMGIASRVNRSGGSSLIVIRGDRNKFEKVQKMFSENRKAKIQSKNIFDKGFELVYELHMNDEEQEDIIRSIYKIDGISGVNILAPETRVA